MALANFFDKISLGASQILEGFDRQEFERILVSQYVLLYFDDEAVSTAEGKATLDLSVRLLARLYPNLQIVNNGTQEGVSTLKALAISINPNINLEESAEPTICIAVGKTPVPFNITTFYVGSDNWNIYLSTSNSLGSGNSNNPIAAGAAACFGAANIFRSIFKDQLPHGKTDSLISLSLFDFTFNPTETGPLIENVDLQNPVLVGAGAIGHGVMWSLVNCSVIKGSITIIDKENVALSNLQRYVLTVQSSIGKSKVAIATELFDDKGLVIIPKICEWKEYSNDPAHRLSPTIFICVDNKETRIEAQALLPQKIFNAWTQQEDLGISRHLNFRDKACLCCLYMPQGQQKSISQQIADVLNLPELVIRSYLANHKNIDGPLLANIKIVNQIKSDELDSFIGKPLDIFYSDAVCGGTWLKLTNSTNKKSRNLQVPCAFESTLAGILLAGEMVKDSCQFTQTQDKTITRFNLLRKISKYINTDEEKAGSCICSDTIYLKVYNEKWTKNILT